MTHRHTKCRCEKCLEADFKNSLKGLSKEIKRGQKTDAFVDGFMSFYKRKAIYEATYQKEYDKQKAKIKKDEERRKKAEKREAETAKKRELREKIKQEKTIIKNTKKQHKDDIKEKDQQIKELTARIDKLEGVKKSSQKISLLKQKTNEVLDGTATDRVNANIDKLKKVLNKGGDRENET